MFFFFFFQTLCPAQYPVAPRVYGNTGTTRLTAAAATSAPRTLVSTGAPGLVSPFTLTGAKLWWPIRVRVDVSLTNNLLQSSVYFGKK